VKNAARLTVLLALLVGCQEGAVDRRGALEETAVSPDAPTPEDAANATYSGIYEESIALREGRYEGEPFVPDGASRPTVGLLDELQLIADLDEDGVDERIVLLWETSGGSGTRLYVARVQPDRRAAATYVGDRVQIRTLGVEGDLLRMEVLRAGADDAMCCPGELATIRWQAAEAGLGFVSDETEGRFGLSTVAGEWRLATEKAIEDTLLAEGTPEGSAEEGDLRVVVTDETARALSAVQEAGITLTISDDGTVTGRSGCNQYSGAVRFSAPNEIAFGTLRLTLMACPQAVMALEQAFLSRLQSATYVGFHLGKLSLNWQTDGTRGAVLFTPR